MRKNTISTLKDLANDIGCNESIESISKAIYKGTNCGAWVTCENNSVSVGSIVEGVDQTTEVHTLTFPFKKKDFWDAVQAVEDEAKTIWEDTHGCEDCFEENENGYIPINHNCKTCHGEGIII